MDMALAKVVNPPSRKHPRDLELEPTGDKQTHADYGMKENATSVLVSTGTSANSAEGHMSRGDCI
jgi:hypothetical protein